MKDGVYLFPSDLQQDSTFLFLIGNVRSAHVVAVVVEGCNNYIPSMVANIKRSWSRCGSRIHCTSFNHPLLGLKLRMLFYNRLRIPLFSVRFRCLPLTPRRPVSREVRKRRENLGVKSARVFNARALTSLPAWLILPLLVGFCCPPRGNVISSDADR